MFVSQGIRRPFRDINQDIQTYMDYVILWLVFYKKGSIFGNCLIEVILLQKMIAL